VKEPPRFGITPGRHRFRVDDRLHPPLLSLTTIDITGLSLAAHNSRPMSAVKLKFTDLPIEILEQVFSHIPDRDIIKLEAVRNAGPTRDYFTLTPPPVTCSRLVDHFEILFVVYQHSSIGMNSFSPV
jgi:hypothetical protein